MKKVIWFANGILCSLILTSICIPATAQADSAKSLSNFLFPGFTKSIIKLRSGQANTAVLNYNTVDQEMVLLQKDSYLVLATPEQVDTIYMENRRFIPFNTGFYELVMTGNVTLFIQHKSIVEPVGTATGYGSTSQSLRPSYVRQIYGAVSLVDLRIPDDYKVVDATDYWIRKKDNSMEKFSTKRQFLKIFKDKGKELDQYIDSNNISFKKINDIIKLMNYCNELYN